jgi:exosome complex RNA-binding protein Rrp4
MLKLCFLPLRYFAFEVAIGVNGAIWIRGTTDIETIVIRNAIQNSEYLDDMETIAMVEKLYQLSKKLQKRKVDQI